jgi:DNA-binding GntR family transcriptional regulator
VEPESEQSLQTYDLMVDMRPPRRDFPPRRGNLKDEVARVIIEDIMSGRVRPGDRIKQDEICQRLGVSRLPVREALITLESSGFVRNPPRQGSFVAHITPADVRDHFTIFGLASGLATRRAVNHLTAEDLVELRAIVDELHRVQDTRTALDLNFRFHRKIHTAGTSYRLRAHIRSLLRVIPESLFAGTEWGPHSEADHLAIIDGLAARDHDRAFSAAAEHLRASGDHAVEMLTRADFWS